MGTRAAWAALLVAMAGVGLSGCSLGRPGAATARPAATQPAFVPSARVGSQRIAASEVDQRARLLALLDPSVPAARAVTRQTAAAALDQLVTESLLLQGNPSPAPASAVGQELASLDQYLTQTYGGAAAVRARERALRLSGADISAFVRREVAVTAAARRYQPAVTRAQVEAYYTAHLSQFRLASPEVHARHILVKTKAQAEAILRQLKAGASFAQLARRDSLDPGSASAGGDLGWFTAGQMVAPFSQAAFSTPVGGYAIAHSQFGWHVIQVLGRAAAGTVPPLSQIYSQVQAAAQQASDRTHLDRALAALRKRFPVRVQGANGGGGG
jgi:parvulin-like peptidyl-prolyl isomerase